jgi:hypothetical protein
VEQTIMLCKALFGSGKFDTVFGDPTTFPLFVMAIKMMERSQTTGRELDATAEIKAQLDRDAMKEADLKEKELVAELVVYLKKKVCRQNMGGRAKGSFCLGQAGADSPHLGWKESPKEPMTSVSGLTSSFSLLSSSTTGHAKSCHAKSR